MKPLLAILLSCLPLWWVAVGCASPPPSETVQPALLPSTTPRPTPTLVPALAVQAASSRAAAAAAPGATDSHTTALQAARPKQTSTPTPTPTPTPSPTPAPAERLALSAALWQIEDDGGVIAILEPLVGAPAGLSAAQRHTALYQLGRAYLRTGAYDSAVTALTELLAASGGQAPDGVYYFLGQAHMALGNTQAAINAYRQYLADNPDMATYVNPFIADAYFALGDREAGVAAYEAALSGAGYRLAEIGLRQRLADFYLADADYAAAVAQYDAIIDLAVTEATKGQMNYLAGNAEMMAGNPAAAFERYQIGVNRYPRAYESYLGLVALVEAGYAVDDYQRGVVDYYARAYQPGVAALERLVAQPPGNYPDDAHLYLAWCYEGLGDLNAALVRLDNFATADPARAAIERARMLARAENGPAAIEAYLAYLAAFPQGEEAPFAAWWAAQWTEWGGDVVGAMARYRWMADQYPTHQDAPEALFRVGLLARDQGDEATAVATWLSLGERYPDSRYAAATLVWLLRTLPAAPADATGPAGRLPEGQTPPSAPPTEPVTAAATLSATVPLTDAVALRQRIEDLVLSGSGTDYYSLRAREMVTGGDPFAASGVAGLPTAGTAAQQEAEAWLRQWLQLDPETPIRRPASILAGDQRLIVGAKLWQLGLRQEAKQELEDLRLAHADSALFSYQLALAYRDLGLYRSSILAAERVIVLSGQSIFAVPAFIGRLAYPTYYAHQVLALAQQYQYDPLVQFALIRQESLYESFARSGAAALGLSQVIPDTGAYIAQKLAWPDYETADLTRPWVGLNFGAFYLAEQLRLFDGFVPAALAAYNAGPGNALRWYEQTGSDLDWFVEAVNFSETRLYIERIYTGFAIYRHLYAAEPTP